MVSTPPRNMVSTPPRTSSTTVRMYRSPSPSIMDRTQDSPFMIAGQRDGNGTKAHPYVIHIDAKRPECNQPFYVLYVPNMKREKHLRSGFHISVDSGVPDYDKFDASIPPIPTDYPEWINRVVQVKGPSQSSWIRSTVYLKSIACVATQQAHEATQLEIESDPDRQFSHWLLVFPENIALDNKTFSGHPEKVLPEFNCMTLEEKETESGEKLHGCVVYWAIAEAGGRQIEADRAKPSAKTLFAKKDGK